MKKKWILCTLLALSILMGVFPVPVSAAETTSAPTESYVPPTETVPDPEPEPQPEAPAEPDSGFEGGVDWTTVPPEPNGG